MSNSQLIELLAHLRAPTAREAGLLLAGLLLLKLINFAIIRPLTSPLRKLRGPDGGRGILGHFPIILDLYNHHTINSWISAYGPTFMIRGPLWVHHRLWTIDARALHHVLNNTQKYPKPELLRKAIWRYLREGLILAEGDRHRIQRKVVQRLFSRSALQSFGRIIQDKADQLRDIYLDLCANPNMTCPYAEEPGNPAKENVRVIDIYSAAARVTYDLIGQVAIDHVFDSTGNWHGAGGQMFDKYEAMQQLVQGSTGARAQISLMWPWFDRWFPSENSRRVEAAMNPLEELSRKHIETRRREIEEGKREKLADRDLLTLMLRVNASEDIQEDQKMTEDELSGQLATFMFAGSETTAGTVAWAILQLACHSEVQSKLRAECLSYGDTLSFEQMDELPYLDVVMKEALRCNPSLPGTLREAAQDDIIPLSTPVTLASGKVVTEIPIRKGQLVHVPIENLHMSTQIWGDDALSFRPERWNTPAHEREVRGRERGFAEGKRGGAPGVSDDGPGVWPNMMSFIDGTRRCVGYKLAIMEIKITLYTMVRNFEFAPVEGKRIYKWNMFSTRPYVAGELFKKGTSLPVQIRPYKG